MSTHSKSIQVLNVRFESVVIRKNQFNKFKMALIKTSLKINTVINTLEINKYTILMIWIIENENQGDSF